MRDIKFRAYSKALGGYIIEPIIVGEDKVFVMRGSAVVEIEDAEILQYTGFKDEDGKEIYEGHIVRQMHRDHADTGKVHFSPTQGYLVGAVPIWPRDLKVIGNMYENPDLL